MWHTEIISNIINLSEIDLDIEFSEVGNIPFAEILTKRLMQSILCMYVYIYSPPEKEIMALIYTTAKFKFIETIQDQYNILKYKNYLLVYCVY